jgi:hypothetical protein
MTDTWALFALWPPDALIESAERCLDEDYGTMLGHG